MPSSAQEPGTARPRPAAIVLELLTSGPILGALLLVGATAWVFAGGDDDRVLGMRASPIVALAKRHFASDVRALGLSLIAIAVAFGAALGTLAEIALTLRSEVRGGTTRASRIRSRLALVALLHLAALAHGIARMPQLYTDWLYLREGRGAAWARTAQVLLTDVLGPGGVIAITAFGFAAYVAPPWRTTRAVLRILGRIVRRQIIGLAAILGATALALLALRSVSAKPKGARGGRPNVLILAVDSLRDDRFDRNHAPRLSAVGREGVRFSRAYVTIPRTLPSWTTILTGREPHRHGLRTMFPRYEDRARDLAALPARLGKVGYRSAVVGDYAADIFTRVRYGFDEVDAPTFNFHALIATRALERAMPLLPLLQSGLGRKIMPPMRELAQAADPRLVADGARRAIGRLDRGEPFLLTVFFSTAHFPYAAPAPFYRRATDPDYRGRFRYHKPNLLGQEAPLDDADVRQVRALYDGAVAAVDAAAGEILDELARRGLDDDTIVIVTADHGEMLFDDGHGQGHGDHLFGDHVLHVPLAMRLPSRLSADPRVVEEVVRDVDVTPTLLELAGLGHASDRVERTDAIDGRSLAPLLFGKDLPVRPAFAETEVWMTESIPEVPAAGPNALRIPYPNVAHLTELDPRLGHDVVLRAEAEPLVIAAKHRMILDGDLKLVFAPTRAGTRWFLFDRREDPAEVHDLSAKRPADLARLQRELWRYILADPKVEEREGRLLPRPERAKTEAGGAALRAE
jgi:arylsulfatase A-like enzyme